MPARPHNDLPSDARTSLDALRRIVRELRLSANAAQKQTGISGAQLFVLQQLAERPAATMGDLAQRTFTHQSSVSVVVRRLAERGLVVRTASPEDARRVTISLSASGKQLLKRAPRAAQERLLAALARLAPKRRRELAQGLADLVAGMGIADQPPELFFEEKSSPRVADLRSPDGRSSRR
jgi:DNA-binding MarR family transcriptional regulator